MTIAAVTPAMTATSTEIPRTNMTIARLRSSLPAPRSSGSIFGEGSAHVGVGRVNRALDLAVARIAIVALVVLVSPEIRSAPEVLAIPPAFCPRRPRLVPPRLFAFRSHQREHGGVCVALGLGFGRVRAFRPLTRPALVVLTVASAYRFALFELAGVVHHDMHQLWFLAIPAAAPSGDALLPRCRIFDQGRPRRAGTEFELRLRLATADHSRCAGSHLLSSGFLETGASLGTAWFWSDNVRNQLHWKWFEVGVVPSIRIDAYPTPLRFGGLLVILFELSFIALVWHRRTRLVALALGLGFHASTRYSCTFRS